MEFHRIGKSFLAAASAAVLGLGLGHTVFSDRALAQERSPENVTVGFVETLYGVGPDGAVLGSKRRFRTWAFAAGQRSAAYWRSGDVEVRMVYTPEPNNRVNQTLVASGDGVPIQKATFDSRLKIETRAEICGLGGEPSREILGFTTYREMRLYDENEQGKKFREAWVAPGLGCMPLQTRIWLVTPDGGQVTIKTLEPLFRRDQVDQAALTIPEAAVETAPSKVKETIVGRPSAAPGPLER
ncbi:MAG: hypothetical protein GC160_10540 [Acidobacteria bacterium]|nr:hypothetical protein [Acidobacteriota bacterium]